MSEFQTEESSTVRQFYRIPSIDSEDSVVQVTDAGAVSVIDLCSDSGSGGSNEAASESSVVNEVNKSATNNRKRSCKCPKCDEDACIELFKEVFPEGIGEGRPVNETAWNQVMECKREQDLSDTEIFDIEDLQNKFIVEKFLKSALEKR